MTIAAVASFLIGHPAEGAAVMRQVPAYDRFQILRRAADLMFERQAELGRIIDDSARTILRGAYPHAATLLS